MEFRNVRKWQVHFEVLRPLGNLPVPEVVGEEIRLERRCRLGGRLRGDGGAAARHRQKAIKINTIHTEETMKKDFLTTYDFTKEELMEIIDLSIAIKKAIKSGYNPPLM